MFSGMQRKLQEKFVGKVSNNVKTQVTKKTFKAFKRKKEK